MNIRLNPNSQEIVNLLLKHYPIQQSQHSSHEVKQQHMHDYRKQRQIFEKPTNQKLQNMNFLKEQGNNHYKNQRYNEAIYFYQKVIIYGDYTFPDNEADTNKMDLLLQQSNCNMALSLIKVDKWEQAKMHLTQTVKGNSASIKCKGLYWLAKLYMKSSEYQKAKDTISELRNIQRDNKKPVEELQAQLHKLQQKSIKQNKQVCKNMFKI